MGINIINRLNHLITIQKLNNILNLWEDVFIVWADIQAIKANIITEYNKIDTKINYIITTRYRNDIKVFNRIFYKGRIFYINSIINVDEKNQLLEINCEEII